MTNREALEAIRNELEMDGALDDEAMASDLLDAGGLAGVPGASWAYQALLGARVMKLAFGDEWVSEVLRLTGRSGTA